MIRHRMTPFPKFAAGSPFNAPHPSGHPGWGSRGRSHTSVVILIAAGLVLGSAVPAAAATPCGPLLAAGKINWTDQLRDFLRDYKLDDTWVIFGFAAQAVFASRFMVQWIASERAGRSIVPTLFWYLSLLGTTMLAVYALHRKDIVFILGQTLNIFIYVRNLMLIYRPKTPGGAAAGA